MNKKIMKICPLNPISYCFQEECACYNIDYECCGLMNIRGMEK